MVPFHMIEEKDYYIDPKDLSINDWVRITRDWPAPVFKVVRDACSRTEEHRQTYLDYMNDTQIYPESANLMSFVWDLSDETLNKVRSAIATNELLGSINL